MHQVAIVGDHDSVIGFRALGMTVIETDDPVEAERQIRRLADDRYAVIFLAEALAASNPRLLREMRERRLPALIPIPTLAGSNGMGMDQMRDSVRRAVGMDLIGQDE